VNISVHIFSLLVAGLAVVSVFVYIPFVSDYAFWFLLFAYVLIFPQAAAASVVFIRHN
jgi:hypothetical protein